MHRAANGAQRRQLMSLTEFDACCLVCPAGWEMVENGVCMRESDIESG